MASAAIISLFTVIYIVFIIAGLLKVYAPVPVWFTELFLYGKVKPGQQSTWKIINFIEVPKSAFLYFYIWGAFWNTSIFAIVLRSYFYGVKAPEIFDELNVILQPSDVNTSATSAILACTMLVFQLHRRTMESLFVSIHSKGTMNILHFLLGVLFYTTVPLAVLSEAPLLDGKVYDLKLNLFQARHLAGINLFFIASFYHNQTNRLFASLRKNKDGKVTGYQHRIPHGGLFNYVSCPHYFAEILTYLAIWTTAGFSNLTMATMFIFVFVNQTWLGYFAHQWYKKTFKTYPKNRAAVFPYIF